MICSYYISIIYIIVLIYQIFACSVRYNVSNWLEKNKDPLNDTLVFFIAFSLW